MLGIVLSIPLLYLWGRIISGDGFDITNITWPTIDPMLVLPGLFFLALIGVLVGSTLGAGRSPHVTYRPEQIDVSLDEVKGIDGVKDEVVRSLNLFLAHKTFASQMGGTARRGRLQFVGPVPQFIATRSSGQDPPPTLRAACRMDPGAAASEGYGGRAMKKKWLFGAFVLVGQAVQASGAQAAPFATHRSHMLRQRGSVFEVRVAQRLAGQGDRDAAIRMLDLEDVAFFVDDRLVLAGVKLDDDVSRIRCCRRGR